MDAVPNHSLLTVTQQDMKKTRQLCNLEDSSKITESLNAIQEWCKKQDHLVEASQYLSHHMLEVLFLMSRGSIERTKMRIDKLFTSRGLMPELALNRSLDEFEQFLDCVNYVPLPKFCPTDQSRVMVTQFLTDSVDEFNLLTYFRYCFMIGEYRMHYDYSFSERYIIDLTNVHLGYLGKINPVVVKKAEVLCSEGYGTKIKGIHILNAPSFVDRLVFILKQALRDKVAERLHVHSSYEDLYKHVPKEILPKEYGGLEQSCDKLAAQWRGLLKTEEASKIIMINDKLVSDESRRQTLKFNEEYLGMPGSFRKLNVD